MIENQAMELKQSIPLNQMFPFKTYGIGRLIFDRIVIAEMQEMFDEGYREKKQRRLEKYGNGFWWSMDNEEIRMPDISSKDND